MLVPDVDVTALAGGADAWWFLENGRRLWRWDGVHPEAVVDLDDAFTGRCLLAAGADVFVGTSEAHLLRLTDGHLDPATAFDLADGRDAWYTPWGGPPDTRSLSVGADGSLYANVHVGGILRSRDSGASWSPTIHIDADVHQVLAHPTEPGRVLAAAAVGLVESRDGGDSWTEETDGLHSTYARAVAVAGDALLLTASTGPRGGRAAVYRRARADGDFERCRAGLPEWFPSNIDSHCLAASGELAAFGTDQGDVYASLDGGVMWNALATGLPPVRCIAIARV